jgi:hypothetical protein
LEDILGCKSCDPETGKLSDKCSACEKCVGKECVTNCPHRCETCVEGTCRPCGERPCEQCDDAGTCYTCDPTCERCNASTGNCETTCKNGLACCAGHCLNCCGGCDRGTCSDRGDAECRDDAGNPACCGPFCYDLDIDPDNCGACQHRCGWHQHCEKGRCLCNGVLESGTGVLAVRGGGMECSADHHECCDGRCVDMASYQSDAEHCGKCVVQCETDERCVNGECVGSQRSGYRLRHHVRATSKLGVESDIVFTAVVRQLARPDADGNTWAGWGTYEGTINDHKINCNNKMPMDWEEIQLGGKARGTATATRSGNTTLVSFAITPLNPPKRHLFTRSFRRMETAAAAELPDAVLPVLGTLQLRNGIGRDSRTYDMPGGSCSEKITVVTEWEATRVP